MAVEEVLKFTAQDQASAVVKQIAENEKKAAADAAKAVVDAEARKERARKEATDALKASGVEVENNAKLVTAVSNRIIAMEKAQAAETIKAAALRARAAEDEAENERQHAKELEDIRSHTADRLRAGLDSLKAAASEAIGWVQRFGDSVVGMARASAEAERSERRLYTALKLRGSITRENFENLKSFNSSLERKLGLDADNLAQLQGTLSLQGVHNDRLQEATRQTIGLAEVTGSLESATRLVARAHEGNIAGLKKYLPQVDSAAEATAEMSKLFKLAEANAGDLVTAFEKLDVAIGNAQEETGKQRQVQDAVAGGTSILTDTIRVYTHNVSKSDGLIDVTLAAARAFVTLGGAAIGVTGRLEREVDSLNAYEASLDQIRIGAEAAKRALDEMAIASGNVDFGDEGEEIESSPEKAQRAFEKRKREAERRKRELEKLNELGAQPDLATFRQIEIDRDTFPEFGPSPDDVAELRRDRRIEEEKEQDRAAKELERSLKRQEQAVQNFSESVVKSSADASQALVGIGISAAQGSLTTEEALKQAAIVALQAGGQIASAAFAQSAAKSAAATTEVIATGASTASNEASKVSQEIPWPASTAIIPAVIAATVGMFATLLSSFEKGGVMGNSGPLLPNGERLAAMKPGERALTPHQTESFDRLVEAIAGNRRATPTGSTNVNLTYQQLVPDRDAAFRRTMRRTVVKELSRLHRDGSPIRRAGTFGPEG